MPKAIFVRKPVDLAELRSGIQAYRERLNAKSVDYYVAENRTLSCREWNALTNRLLQDFSWIAEFSNQKHPVTAEGIPCIRVTAPGSEIALIIDPQGCGYARYVSIEAACASSEIEEEKEPPLNLTAKEVEDALLGMLYGDWDVENSFLEGCGVQTFENAGIITSDKGLVITMPNGSEFQLTIIQSR